MKGIVGVYSRNEAIKKALYTLYGVQHRGQESAGISAAGDHSIRTWKGKGLVSNVFDEHFTSFIHPDDYIAIGCASGERSEQKRIAPIHLNSERYGVSVALDGYIPYKNDQIFEEILGYTFLHEMELHKNVFEAMSETMKKFSIGYYSLVMVLHDKKNAQSRLVAARDHRGIRPLYFALNEEESFFTSESAPVDVLESMGVTINEKMDLTPGMVVVYGDEGLEKEQILDPKPAHCAFEWVYFGRPDSIIEGKNVHEVRKNLGYTLVETHSLDNLYNIKETPKGEIIVIPVPDSGRSVCVGVAEALRVTADEGVIKNAYLGRTYIIDDPEYRRIASDLKHNIIKETVKGKKVIITDDSIVRGTVSETIAKSLLHAGASEVEYLVSYAPIYYPCFSDPSNKTLSAAPFANRGLFEVGDFVASNFPSIKKVRYNSIENIINSINLLKSNICTYCISGENPFS